jgi:hypothetical protein
MRGHVVRSFDVVQPTRILGRNPGKCRGKIGTHIGVGIFLYDQRYRRVPHEQEKATVLRSCLGKKAGRIMRDLGKALRASLPRGWPQLKISGTPLTMADNR